MNCYEWLRKCNESGADEPIKADASWTLTDASEEAITIHLAITTAGKWCYGYSVFWADGRQSSARPSAGERGVFDTPRAAKLHAIGFFQQYREYYTPATRHAVDAAEGMLAQTTLEF